jgi:type II secretory pathway component PulF
VELLKSAAVRMAEFGELTGRLRGRLAGLADESRGRLLRTAAGGLVV